MYAISAVRYCHKRSILKRVARFKPPPPPRLTDNVISYNTIISRNEINTSFLLSPPNHPKYTHTHTPTYCSKFPEFAPRRSVVSPRHGCDELGAGLSARTRLGQIRTNGRETAFLNFTSPNVPGRIRSARIRS